MESSTIEFIFMAPVKESVTVFLLQEVYKVEQSGIYCRVEKV